MAIKGTEAGILIDEYNFDADTSGLTINITTGEGDSTNLASTAMESSPLLPSMSIEQSGYVTGIDDADELEKQLYSRLGSGTNYVAALLGKSTDACPAYVLDGTFGSNMTIAAPVAALMTLNGTWGMGRSGYRGIRIVNAATISATGNQTAVDLGSAGSDGGAAFLFVSAITGTATNASFKVQSATTSGGVYADEGTFTVSAVGGYKVSLSGTINQFVRLNCAGLGGATDITVTCICAVNGVTT